MYKGCASSLLAEHSTSNQPYHGKDGFGDVDLENIDPVDMSCIKREHAAAALCRLVNEQPGKNRFFPCLVTFLEPVNF